MITSRTSAPELINGAVREQNARWSVSRPRPLDHPSTACCRGARSLRGRAGRVLDQRRAGLGLHHPALLRRGRLGRDSLFVHGATRAPRTILEGGSISFFDPSDDHVRQVNWSPRSAGPVPRDLGLVDQKAGSLRGFVDWETPQPLWTDGAPSSVKAVAHAIEREGRKRSCVRPCQTLRPKIDPLPGR